MTLNPVLLTGFIGFPPFLHTENVVRRKRSGLNKTMFDVHFSLLYKEMQYIIHTSLYKWSYSHNMRSCQLSQWHQQSISWSESPLAPIYITLPCDTHIRAFLSLTYRVSLATTGELLFKARSKCHWGIFYSLLLSVLRGLLLWMRGKHNSAKARVTFPLSNISAPLESE